MTWRVAKSLDVLLGQINRAFPNRNKASDGGIGDANHLAEGWDLSDHNPWYPRPAGGIVTARDFTHDPAHGVDINRLSDELAASRDPRIKYMIANRLILDSRHEFHPWMWMPYHGVDPHTNHLHLSVMDSPTCDNESPWNLPMLGGQNGDDMLKDERDALYDVREQLTGARPVGEYPGWPAREDLSNKPKSLVDYVRAIHAEVTKYIDLRATAPVPIKDTTLGHAASANGQVANLHAKMDDLRAELHDKLDAVLAKLP